jgi:hypothetical protein
MWEPVPDMNYEEVIKLWLDGQGERPATRNNGTEIFDDEWASWRKLPDGWCIMRQVADEKVE